MRSNEADKYALLLEIETHHEAISVATYIKYNQIIAHETGGSNLQFQFRGSLPCGFFRKIKPRAQLSSRIGMDFGKFSKCLIREDSHASFSHHDNLPHLQRAIDVQRVEIFATLDKLAVIVAAIPCGIPCAIERYSRRLGRADFIHA